MGYIVTPNLGLQEADPATIQLFETPVFNANLNAIDTAIGADRGRLTPLENASVKSVTDLDALILNSASAFRGRIIYVANLAANFQSNGTIWVQATSASVATVAIRDTEYAKAAAAFRVTGAQVRTADTGFVWEYNSLVSAWVGVFGAMLGGSIVRANVAGNFGAASWTALNNGALWVTDQTPQGVTYLAGVFTCITPGLYDAEGGVQLDTTVNAWLALKKNDTSASGTGGVAESTVAGVAGTTAATVRRRVKLAVGDTLMLAIYVSAVAVWSITNLQGSFFGVRYVEASR